MNEVFFRARHAIQIFRKRFLFLDISTKLELPSDFVFDEGIATGRGRIAPDGNHYSLGYELTWDDIPTEIKKEIKKFDSVLRLYFGDDYLIDKATIWRNTGIPEEYRELDIYSQVWHYDHVVDYRNVQLFVLLSNTTLTDGPFEYILNPSNTRIYGNAASRENATTPDAQIGKFTGLRGDGMLFSTGSTPHRAGIPEIGCQRDMFSIAFFPAYTGIGFDARALLAEVVI